MEKARLPRREREKRRHRRDILAVALRLFSERGFHNVSMQEIAEKSECGVGTLYNFFASKERLFIELMLAGIEKIRARLIPILDSDKPETERLSEYVRAHTDLVESNLDLVRLYTSQYGIYSSIKPMLKDIADVARNIEMLVSERLKGIILAGIEKEVFNPVAADVVVLALQATLQAFGLECSERFDKTKAQEGFTGIEKFFLGALLREKAGC